MQQKFGGRLGHALSFLRHDGGHFAQFVWGRFQQDRLTVTAGYLAYVTLLSLVPMVAVVFGMMSAFPVFQTLKQQMEQFVYHNFVPTAGEMLKEYIDGFVANATNTTAVGIGALIVVALMLISAIDKNLNYIWRSTRSRPLAQAFAMYWMILTLGGAVAVGFFGIAYFSANPDLAGPVTENPERVFIELAKLLFNPWIAGILLSAILAAVMSTLSCQLLVCSSALTEDFYKAFLRKGASQAELVWVGRGMVLLIAIVAIMLAANPENRVLGLVSYAWAGFGAAFGPVVILSLVWKQMTRNGALAGMLVGALTVILWKNFLGHLGLYEIIPGFIFATIAILVFSKIGSGPSASMIKRFDEAEKEYQSA